MSAGSDEAPLLMAITLAVESIRRFEAEADHPSLVTQIRECFIIAASTLDLGRTDFEEMVFDFADAAYSSLFPALGERIWHYKEDFLKVVEVGVKVLFPASLLENVTQMRFESAVLDSSDLAFDKHLVESRRLV